ncbi:MAG TPA: phosphonate C-P lyase system protein PhnH [Mucilaginibacter sp.]|jgi:alpha-D-ribose 1-methylphosphonate 5-triphosphate synthase subunit PhnH
MRREINYDEVFDAQEQFRLLLDSMAHPGKINLLPDMDVVPPTGLNKGSALIAFALLNTDVSFHASGVNSKEISSYIALNTTSQPVTVHDADFIFIGGLHHEGILFEAKTGNLPYPEESATFIIDVETTSQEAIDDAILIVLKGPGIKTEERVYIKGIQAELLAAVKEQNTEFPLGVDLMITDQQNRVICIPRSNQFVIENATATIA